MAIPHMPSFVDVYLYASSAVPSAEGTFPCRVVPCAFVGLKPVSAIAYTWFTHWVDMEPGIVIPTGFGHPPGVPASLSYSYNPDNAAVLVHWHVDEERTILVALATEKRYVDTPDEYLRVWCHRIRENNLLFELPS